LLLLIPNISLGQLPDDLCKGHNTAYEEGEKLVYKVYYNWGIIWVPAGEVAFTTIETDSQYIFTAIGKSYPSYESVFRVNDFYQTKVNKSDLRPKEFVRYIEEGDYTKFDSLYFNPDANRIHSLNGKNKSKARWESYPLEACYLDLLSVMYRLRNIDINHYRPTESLSLEMFFDKEVYPIDVLYEKNEKKKIKDLGKFNTIKIIPKLIVGNVFKEGDVMEVWVSKDENKIPLLIQSPISVGSIKAVLKSYSGLKHPLSCKL